MTQVVRKTISFSILCIFTLMLGTAALAMETTTPCVPEPHEYQYTDDTRAITIDCVQQEDIVYYVADIQLASATEFHTALSGDKPEGDLEGLSAIAARTDAVLALNGDDYGVHNFGTIIRNGELLRARDTTRNMLIVDHAGDFSVIIDRKGENPKVLGQKLMDEGVLQTFEFGPVLIRDGQPAEFSDAFDIISTNPDRREPRTAIGQIGPLHYIAIIVDGRQDGYSLGISLQDLQNLFMQYGAQTAINLDGGGSTELWFQGQIINRPSGGEERSISDILYF